MQSFQLVLFFSESLSNTKNELRQTEKTDITLTIQDHPVSLFLWFSSDPVSYIDGLVSLKSRHRKELCVLENELDESHARDLEAVRSEATNKAKDELQVLERALIEKLKSEGSLILMRFRTHLWCSSKNNK